MIHDILYLNWQYINITFMEFLFFSFEDLLLVPSFHNSHNLYVLQGVQWISNTMCRYALSTGFDYSGFNRLV